MIEKEEYFAKVFKTTIRDMVQTLLQTKEFSKRFLTREDRKEIDKEVDKISVEVTSLFISKLKNEGYLENDKELSEKEFEKLLSTTVNEYFGEKSESGSD